MIDYFLLHTILLSETKKIIKTEGALDTHRWKNAVKNLISGKNIMIYNRKEKIACLSKQSNKGSASCYRFVRKIMVFSNLVWKFYIWTWIVFSLVGASMCISQPYPSSFDSFTKWLLHANMFSVPKATTRCLKERYPPLPKDFCLAVYHTNSSENSLFSHLL